MFKYYDRILGGGGLTKDADTANIWEDDGGLC